jgi:hypothetical protein
MEKTTPRLLAKAQGLKRYIGQPCIHGHNGERHVRNNGCVHCHSKTKRSTPKYGKPGRPRKHELFVGPAKPKRVVFKPKTEIDRWIVRSKGNKKAKLRKALSIEDYKKLIVSHCPLLEVKLTYEKYEGTRTPNNYATLDKIDPTKGYVIGNVQIISFRANTLKNSATLEELKLIVKNWVLGSI